MFNDLRAKPLLLLMMLRLTKKGMRKVGSENKEEEVKIIFLILCCWRAYEHIRGWYRKMKKVSN
jgi:hypothetical protein